MNQNESKNQRASVAIRRMAYAGLMVLFFASASALYQSLNTESPDLDIFFSIIGAVGFAVVGFAGSVSTLGTIWGKSLPALKKALGVPIVHLMPEDPESRKRNKGLDAIMAKFKDKGESQD